MTNFILSILIPATPDRIKGMEELLRRLGRERMISNMFEAFATHGDEWIAKDHYEENGICIEVVVYCDNKRLTLGEKRANLYKRAYGKYSWQIDSDDLVSENAILLILEAIKQEPDCVTFQEHCLMNGVDYKSNHSLEYSDWEGDGNRVFEDGFQFHRTPFYKNVIKTEIARSVPFEHIRYGEDHAWSSALKPHLKTEIHIPEDIYFYIHNSKPEEHSTRYGYDRD